MYTKKHYKRLIVSLSIVIILAFLITTFYISKKPFESSENTSIWESKGTIVHQIGDVEDFWGLEISFWDHLFGPKKLRIKNLPENFQVEQLRVKVRYGIADVIGTSDWDVIIEIIDIQKI